MKKIFSKVASLLMIFALLAPVAQAEVSLRVMANDTIAGYSTAFRTSYGEANKNLIFRVQKPDNSILEIPVQSDEIGVAEADFLGFHTKKAGRYQVSVYPQGGDYYNKPTTAFNVYPDEVSEFASALSVDSAAIAADGQEQALLKVSLRDRYDNPIANHNVLIISSRPTDTITKVSKGATDEKGNLFYYISSRQTGVSYLSAIDQTTNKVFEDREKIVFFEPDNAQASDRGGNFNNYGADIFGGVGNSTYQANLFDESANADESFEPIDHFDIDFPAKVQVGSDQNFLKVIAKDRNGNTVKNYTGTIIISTPKDENAVLPGDDGKYTFQSRDQGERTFDLALIFSKPGTQTILIYDFDPDTNEISEFIKGEKAVEVVSSESGTTTDNSGALEIKKPADNSRSGNATLTLVGKARPNTNLKIFIDDVKIDQVEVDADGLFTKEILNMENGRHTIFVREAEGSQESSKIVNFEIDTTPPTLNEYKITPEGGVKADEAFTISVYADSGLDKVSFSAGALTEDLLEDKTAKGKYEITVKAPVEPGEFPLTFILADDLGNTAKFSNAGILKILPDEDKPQPEIKDLKAEGLDGKVEISWSTIVNLPAEAAEIRILSGKNKFNLQEGEKFPLTTTKITASSLENGTPYFFALTLFDAANNELWRSETLESTPDPMHAAGNEFVATAGNQKAFLRWSATEAAFFEIKIGVRGTSYIETLKVKGTVASTIIEDLINGQHYVFTITPLDATGKATGVVYPQAEATPTWDGAHPAPVPPIIQDYTPPKTADNGPFSNPIFLSSLFFGFAVLFIRKSFLLFRS